MSNFIKKFLLYAVFAALLLMIVLIAFQFLG